MKKLVNIGIGVCVLVVLGFAGYSAYKKGNERESFVKEVNRNLSADDRKTFEDRVTEDRQKIAISSSDDEKFGWYMQLGFNLDALGSLSDAQDAFGQAIKLKPDEFTGYAGLFQVQADRRDYAGAEQSIKNAILKYPTDVDLWKKYAQLEIDHMNATNDTISALYSEAVVKTNGNIDILTVYAAWLEKVGNLQVSKEYWQKAIVANPAGKKLYQIEIDKINKQLKQPQ